MKLAILFTTTLSGALTAAAATAYQAPAELLALAQDEANGCILPTEYFIRDFAGRSNDAGASVASYDFHYRSVKTATETQCHFNASSVSTTPEGLTPRFACENHDVKFIWQGERKRLYMVERVCPNAKGIPQYEVSGSVDVPFVCDAVTSMCVAKPTELKTKFTSIHVVLDPTWITERK